MRRGLALLLVFLAALAAGCATSKALRSGEQAERRQDYDRAVLEYSRAVQQDPDHLTARRALERARLRASVEHLKGGRRLAGRGMYKEAIDEYTLALDLNPGNLEIANEIKDVEERRRAGQNALTIDQVKERAREHALPGLS